MLSILAWIPRIARWFGMARGVMGTFGAIFPYVSSFLRGRRAGAARPAVVPAH